MKLYLTILILMNIITFIWGVQYYLNGNIQQGNLMMVLTIPAFILNIISLYIVCKHK